MDKKGEIKKERMTLAYIRPIQLIQQEDKSGKIETKEEYKYIECMSIVRMLYNF